MIIKIYPFNNNSVVIESDDKRYRKIYSAYKVRTDDLFEEMKEIDRFVEEEFNEDAQFQICGKRAIPKVQE